MLIFKKNIPVTYLAKLMMSGFYAKRTWASLLLSVFSFLFSGRSIKYRANTFASKRKQVLAKFPFVRQRLEIIGVCRTPVKKGKILIY
jgi:type II secretory pathway component PulF